MLKEVFWNINLIGAKLLGNEFNKLIDVNLKEFIAKGSHSTLKKFLGNVFENKEHTGCEVKLKSTSGKSVYIYLKGAMIDENQKCLLSMTDITELKEAQMALIESEELYHSLLKTST